MRSVRAITFALKKPQIKTEIMANLYSGTHTHTHTLYRCVDAVRILKNGYGVSFHSASWYGVRELALVIPIVIRDNDKKKLALYLHNFTMVDVVRTAP